MTKSSAVLVGQRIQECRKAQGESLEEIGNLVGVNKSTVMRWERGETERISLPIIRMLAAHFDVSTDWLAGNDVPKRHGNTGTLDEKLSGIDFALSGELHDLTDEEKKDILDYVRFKKEQKKGK